MPPGVPVARPFKQLCHGRLSNGLQWPSLGFRVFFGGWWWVVVVGWWWGGSGGMVGGGEAGVCWWGGGVCWCADGVVGALETILVEPIIRRSRRSRETTSRSNGKGFGPCGTTWAHDGGD